MSRKRKTRAKNGYRQVRVGDRWEWEHREVMAEKLGRPIKPGFEVHHINKDPKDNDPGNLVEVHPSVHRTLDRTDATVCLRCGRPRHWARDCYAKTYADGKTRIED